jgi:hypothetical protein
MEPRTNLYRPCPSKCTEPKCTFLHFNYKDPDDQVPMKLFMDTVILCEHNDMCSTMITCEYAHISSQTGQYLIRKKEILEQVIRNKDEELRDKD